MQKMSITNNNKGLNILSNKFLTGISILLLSLVITLSYSLGIYRNKLDNLETEINKKVSKELYKNDKDNFQKSLDNIMTSITILNSKFDKLIEYKAK